MSLSKRLINALAPIIAAAADEQRRGALRPGTMATIELPATALIELLDAVAVEGRP